MARSIGMGVQLTVYYPSILTRGVDMDIMNQDDLDCTIEFDLFMSVELPPGWLVDRALFGALRGLGADFHRFQAGHGAYVLDEQKALFVTGLICELERKEEGLA